MGEAAKAMKVAHNNMDIDQVENLMDEITEQQQIADEISQAISNPVAFGGQVDEDELMKELEDLEQEQLDKELLDTGNPARLPEVPSGPVAEPSAPARKYLIYVSIYKLTNIFKGSKVKDDDDDLKELEAWAN